MLRPLRNELNAAAVVLQQQASVLNELSETGDRWRYISYTEVRKSLAMEIAESANLRVEIMADLDAFSTDLRREVSSYYPMNVHTRLTGCSVKRSNRMSKIGVAIQA